MAHFFQNIKATFTTCIRSIQTVTNIQPTEMISTKITPFLCRLVKALASLGTALCYCLRRRLLLKGHRDSFMSRSSEYQSVSRPLISCDVISLEL